MQYLDGATLRHHVERIRDVLDRAQVTAWQSRRDGEDQEHDEGAKQPLHSDNDEGGCVVDGHHFLLEDVLASLLIPGTLQKMLTAALGFAVILVAVDTCSSHGSSRDGLNGLDGRWLFGRSGNS